MSSFPKYGEGYKLLQELTELGAKTKVWRAMCYSDRSFVSIKIVQDMDEDLAFRLNETMNKNLNHLAICVPYCVFYEDNRQDGNNGVWIVSPYLSMGSALSIFAEADHLQIGLPEIPLGAILRRILVGICYLHSKETIHGNIRLSNLLLDYEGDTKLSDVGFSCSRSGSLDSARSPPPYWAAPEGPLFNEKSDIWSFGILALELANGYQAFSVPHLAISFCKKKDFSDPFKEMLTICLHQDPDKRPSAPELLSHKYFNNESFISSSSVKWLLKGLLPVHARKKKVSNSNENLAPDGCDIIKWELDAELMKMVPVMIPRPQAMKMVQTQQLCCSFIETAKQCFASNSRILQFERLEEQGDITNFLADCLHVFFKSSSRLIDELSLALTTLDWKDDYNLALAVISKARNEIDFQYVTAKTMQLEKEISSVGLNNLMEENIKVLKEGCDARNGKCCCDSLIQVKKKHKKIGKLLKLRKEIISMGGEVPKLSTIIS